MKNKIGAVIKNPGRIRQLAEQRGSVYDTVIGHHVAAAWIINQNFWHVIHGIETGRYREYNPIKKR